MKSLTLLAFFFAISISNLKAQYSIDYPVFASDNIQALQGLKQKIGTTVMQWNRPSANNMDLSKYIGAIALNPLKLNQVFFVDNSNVPKLYIFNSNTQLETYTGSTFVGASQGSNGTTSLPLLQNEDALGINMMAINSTLNKGFAISKEHNLFSFNLSGTITISAPNVITDAPGNIVLFANAKGGGLMANNVSKLTALVNVLQTDLTYKYHFFEINPVTFKAKYIREAFINYNGFDDNTMFISGAGVTADGSIFCSLYNGNESSLYMYNGASTFNVSLATNNQSIGDVTGAGQVIADFGNLVTTGTLAIDFNELAGSYNKNEKNTTIKWGLFSDEPINNFLIQSSTDGINFKDIATQTPASSYGYNNYSSLINSNKNATVYYRIAAVRPNNTQKLSKVISVNETNNVKTTITTYPNPVTNLLNIKLSESKSISQINILDIKGQAVVKIKGNSSAVINKQINLLEYNLVSGQYYVQVIFEDNSKQTVTLSIKR